MLLLPILIYHTKASTVVLKACGTIHVHAVALKASENYDCVAVVVA